MAFTRILLWYNPKLSQIKCNEMYRGQKWESLIRWQLKGERDDSIMYSFIVPILVKWFIITLQDLFGPPRGTICDKFSIFYLDGPVIEASDEARALRSGYCTNKINFNTLSLCEKQTTFVQS